MHLWGWRAGLYGRRAWGTGLCVQALVTVCCTRGKACLADALAALAELGVEVAVGVTGAAI